MASQVDVENAALSKLGTWPITSITDSSQEARAMAAAWDRLRNAEMCAFPWKFSFVRKAIGRLSEVPAFGYSYQYELPAGFLRLVEINNSWCWDTGEGPAYSIEGRRLLCNIPSPLELRWAGLINAEGQAITVGDWHHLFVEVMACRLAKELAEKLTGANAGMKQDLEYQYQRALSTARVTDAIERASVPPRDSSWFTVRM